MNPSDATGPRWAVVGGGMLGLTLAHRLRDGGARVTVFEAAPWVGGLAGAWSLGPVVWDRHYHVILTSDTSLRRLLAEIDLEGELRWATTRTAFYTGGRLHPLSSVREFLTFPPLGLADRARLAATVLYASRTRDWRRLERVPATDWLRRLAGRRTYETLWLPLLRAKLGDDVERVSAAFIWAIIQRMYRARRTPQKRELFGYVAGGYARILERFAQVLGERGVALRTGHAVTRIERRAGGLRLQFAHGASGEFDRCVLTLPAPLAARTCPDLDAGERRLLQGIEYRGVLCPSVLLRRGLGGYYITNITDPGLPFTAVIEMSALVDRAELGGHHLVYLPRYASANDPCFADSDERIEAQFVAGLRRLYPEVSPADVIACRISRARHVLALPTLDYSQRLPPMATSVAGLHIVNSAHIVNGTLNVNETVQLAEQAAAGLIRDGRAVRPDRARRAA